MSEATADLCRIWHRVFGNVKCWSEQCPVCRDTDWPLAAWVKRPKRDEAIR